MNTMAHPTPEVTILNRQRRHGVSTLGLSRFALRLTRELPADPRCSLGICLVSDSAMREYNLRYRGRDATTDVLSFSARDDGFPGDSTHLGDIVISVPRAAAQARERGHSLAREIKRLLLHGYLHLQGYDHETDDGAMSRLERRLSTRLLARPRRGSR